jgi:ribosomal protein S12 methylthiotransferase
MPIKVGMISLGCPKNQVDAEIMLAKLHSAGFELTNEAGLSDVVIINTCGFIEEAKKESIENILEMALLKKEGTIKGIVVSGCLAQRYFDDMQKEFPEVNCIVSVGSAGEIIKAVETAYSNKTQHFFGEPQDLELSGDRIITTLPFYAYLKIAEGCDNCCTYCIIPKLRGHFRSRPIEQLVEEAQKLADDGVRELILVAQDTTRYGEDLYGKAELPKLLHELCKIEQLVWIRVLYGYPDRITDELIETIASEPKIAKYLDIPIQHVNDRILKAMHRRGNKQLIIDVVNKLRERIPGIVLRTTVITGFPGETEQEFTELSEFIGEMRFERLGAFTYSCEDGTAAALFDGQLDEEVKQHRQQIIMEQQETIGRDYNESKIGKKIKVITEGFDRYAECYFGRSEADAPDIDGKVFFTSKAKVGAGTFVNVKVTDVMDWDLMGERIK